MSLGREIRTALVWALHLIAFGVVTIALLVRRTETTQTHAVLAYLLVILSASALTQRVLGFVLAVLGVVFIDVSFQVPYGRLGPDRVLDLLVLVAFLAVALVTTQLLVRARERTGVAEARAREIAQMAEERIELMSVAGEARRQAETARVRSQVLGGLSHDLRTPLTTIRALAQEAILTGTAHGEAIDEQAARLEQHVTNLLDLARMRSHSFPMLPAVNTAEDLLGAVTRQVRGTLNGRTIRVHIDTAAAPQLGRFDFVQTLRALGNVVDNAIRVTPEGGQIDIGTDANTQTGLVVWVGDRGPGIADDQARLVFEAFYRPPNAPVDGARAGLGLAIAEELIQQQGGTISHMPRPGGGTVFRLVLPSATDDIEGDLTAGEPE